MTRHVRSTKIIHRSGFTLVELLVVIGIIALLISVLLPALNRARQAANALDCQARLRTMGQALFIYTTAHKGLLPWAVIVSGGNRNNPDAARWWWTDTLTEVLDKSSKVGSNGNLTRWSPIFRDKDTVDVSDDSNHTSHYTCNPRLLYSPDLPDPVSPLFGGNGTPFNYPQRKIGNVKRSAEVMVIWDAPQLQDNQGGAYGVAEAIDGWGWYKTGLLLESPSTLRPEVAILPGELGTGGFVDGKAQQRTQNRDSSIALSGRFQSHLRFRHMNNTTLCALLLDGHVATRKVGTVLRQDIYTNYR